jgi:hypothetical protein
MIGRTDIVLQTPPGFYVTDLILRVCRNHWGKCLFQDAESSETHSLNEPWIWSVGARSKEFFIYRDSKVADEWADRGAYSEPNSMLHFLVEAKSENGLPHAEVTLVCDGVDGEVGSIIESLKSGFLCAMSDIGQAA